MTDAANGFVEGMVNFTVDTTRPDRGLHFAAGRARVNNTTGMVEWTTDGAVSSVGLMEASG